MRKEVKIALVLVLIGVVSSAIYFFSGSQKTIEVAQPKPLVPSVVTPSTVQPPVTPEPSTPVVAPRPEEPVAVTPPRPETVTPAPKPATPGGSKAVWTIDLEPLTNAPATKPTRLTEKTRQARTSAMESAVNKVVPNQPISLEPEFGTIKPGTVRPGAESAVTPAGQIPAAEKTHVVKSGETLYQIAKQYYGNGEKWKLIAKANPKLSPTKVRVGDKLIIPAEAPKALAVAPTTTSPAVEKKVGTTKTEKTVAGTTTEPGKTRTYKVRYGDTLQIIAHDQLGSSARWKEILKLNKKLKNDPMRLKANMTIVLPEK
jgi:nucleoid-associated protein YgaU